MDILTQRCSPLLGTLLSGCDVLAWDALYKNHPALAIIEPPIVFCDRGFGASILREGVPLYGNERNPLPTIQIPYSKLMEQYNLSSILHEAGHEAMVRLGLVSVLPKCVRAALDSVSAPDSIIDLYSMWMFEIGPDFWTFCNCGMAEAATIKEILSLPTKLVFQVSPTDPHPNPLVRVLLSFQWCKYLWGSGLWDQWENMWLEAYPIEHAPEESRRIIHMATKYMPIVSKTLFNTRFKILNDMTIPSLFDLDVLNPWKLRRIVDSLSSGTMKLTGLSPCTQLAAFRLLRDAGNHEESVIYDLMTRWLKALGKRKSILLNQ